MTTLDGATQPGDPLAYPADAGEFAARWNAWPPATRDRFLRAAVREAQTASACFHSHHHGRIRDLERRLADTTRLLTEAHRAAATAGTSREEWTYTRHLYTPWAGPTCRLCPERPDDPIHEPTATGLTGADE